VACQTLRPTPRGWCRAISRRDDRDRIARGDEVGRTPSMFWLIVTWQSPTGTALPSSPRTCSEHRERR
jgi:hypothetical protein